MNENNKKTVLVIDDDDIIRNMMQSMLTRMGFQVIVAENGSRGIELAQGWDGDIHLAIMDLFLPDIRGDKVCPVVLEKHPAARVIMMSGYALENTNVLQTQVHGFLQKPCNYDELAQAVENALD